MNKIIIYKDHSVQRLDKFLTTDFKGFSRSAWQKMIKQGRVLVNDKKITPHHFIKTGDYISIEIAIDKYKFKKIDIDVPIITATDDYLIIDKPAGLIVHPSTPSQETALTDIIVKKYPALKKVGENKSRPGIVHRLDKQASGVMVIASHNQMFLHLKKQFQNRQVKKIYLCLIHGQMPIDAGRLDFNIGRSKKTGLMVARPKSQTGKASLTEYEVIKKWQHYSYLKIILHTGRTHQIRLHLNASGHPILGENQHLPKKLKNRQKIDRLFLHSHLLGFYDLNNVWQEYISPLPQELQSIIDKLK